MGFKLTSTGKLKEELSRRAAELAGKKAAARIIVPDDMKWWYYQEFGTATHAEQGTDNPDGYTIDPVNADGLRLPITGEHPVAKLVPHVGQPTTRVHPGVEAHHMVTRVLPDIYEKASEAAVAALQQGGYTFDPLRGALVDTMEHAKEIITDSFAEQLPGKRTDPEGAKLPDSAAEEFSNNAEIEDVSD